MHGSWQQHLIEKKRAILSLLMRVLETLAKSAQPADELSLASCVLLWHLGSGKSGGLWFQGGVAGWGFRKERRHIFIK